MLEELFLHSCSFIKESEEQNGSYVSICQTLCSECATSSLQLIELNNSIFEFDSSLLCDSWKGFHQPKSTICDVIIYDNYAERFIMKI